MLVPLLREEITPAWLNGALGAGWPRISDVSVEPIPGANPRLSQPFRVHLRYDGDAERAAPRSVVVKLPAARANDRAREAGYGAYECEINTYRVLCFAQGSSLLRVLSTVYEKSTRLGALIFEDLGPQPPAGAELDTEAAKSVIDSLAAIHSRFWENAPAGSDSWLGEAQGADLFGSSHEVYLQRWNRLKSWPRPQLTRSAVRAGDALAARLGEIEKRLMLRPRTLIHADLHQGNVLTRLPAPGQPVIIDWQAAAFSGATSDLAKFMCTSIKQDALNGAEEHLFRRYHDALLSNGVTGYCFDRLQVDFRLACLAIFANYVIAAPAPDAEDDFSTGVRRSLSKLIDAIDAAGDVVLSVI